MGECASRRNLPKSYQNLSHCLSVFYLLDLFRFCSISRPKGDQQIILTHPFVNDYEGTKVSR